MTSNIMPFGPPEASTLLETVLHNIFDCLLLPRKTKREAEVKLDRFCMLTEGMSFDDRVTIRKALRRRISGRVGCPMRKMLKEWDWIERRELDQFVNSLKAIYESRGVK